MQDLSHRGPLSPRTLALAIATGALAAGCGTSSKPAAASGSGSGSRYENAVRYSDCMRNHGVSGFPDPTKTANGGAALIIHAGPGSQFDPTSPAFQSAQQACAKLAPKGGLGSTGRIPAQAKQQGLRFSACMRSHGVPSFPDPVFSGNGVRLNLNPGSGINPASPAFKAAQKACGAPLPGGVISSSSSVGGPG
jgi:hypothetical protein